MTIFAVTYRRAYVLALSYVLVPVRTFENVSARAYLWRNCHQCIAGICLRHFYNCLEITLFAIRASYCPIKLGELHSHPKKIPERIYVGYSITATSIATALRRLKIFIFGCRLHDITICSFKRRHFFHSLKNKARLAYTKKKYVMNIHIKQDREYKW